MLADLLPKGTYKAEIFSDRYRLYTPAEGFIEVYTMNELYRLVRLIPQGSAVEGLPKRKPLVAEISLPMDHQQEYKSQKYVDIKPTKKKPKRALIKDLEVRLRAWRINQTKKKV